MANRPFVEATASLCWNFRAYVFLIQSLIPSIYPIYSFILYLSFISSFIPSLCLSVSFIPSVIPTVCLSLSFIPSFIPSLCLSLSFISSFIPTLSILVIHSIRYFLSLSVLVLHSFPLSIYPCRMYNTMRCAIWRESVTTVVEWRTTRTGAPCWRSSTITTVRPSSRTRGTASTTAEFTTHRPTERSVPPLNKRARISVAAKGRWPPYRMTVKKRERTPKASFTRTVNVTVFRTVSKMDLMQFHDAFYT